jgi:hypothetical protein
MSKKKEETSIEEVKPKKPKANGKNSPVIGDNGLQTEPGDNAKYLAVNMELYKLPSIDLKDPEQVNKRLEEYFEIHFKNDLKPTVAGMGMALGLDRRRLWEIKTDALDRNVDIPTLTRDSIKKAYVIMENLWENYMQNGKINPVSGIFLGKNNFGYQDKTEHIITPTINSNNDYSAEEIRQRYLTDSATINSTDFSDSDTES